MKWPYLMINLLMGENYRGGWRLAWVRNEGDVEGFLVDAGPMTLRVEWVDI